MLARQRIKVWLLAPLCLVWLFWRDRKRRTFHGVTDSIHKLCHFWSIVYGFSLDQIGKFVDHHQIFFFCNFLFSFLTIDLA